MPECVQEKVPLAPYTTLKVGGTADYFAEVTTEVELMEVIRWAKKEALPIIVLGGGSNVLIDDAGIRGVVVYMKIRGITTYTNPDGEYVEVGAGEVWDDFVEYTTQRGLWGLENLSGIPGSIGAAPVQNINAYGSSVADSITLVRAYHSETGEHVLLSKEACRFGYRESYFKSSEGSKYIITQVTFVLTQNKKINLAYRSASQSVQKFLADENITNPTPNDVRRAIRAVRKNIGMLPEMFSSAGSFFKNTIVSKDEFKQLEKIIVQRYAEKALKLSPWHWTLEDGREKVSTAFLMECTPYNKSGVKNMAENGAVGISPLHTLSLINLGGACAEDISHFALEIIDAIKNEFGVTIESEVCHLK